VRIFRVENTPIQISDIIYNANAKNGLRCIEKILMNRRNMPGNIDTS
jgi:hypothetical protein